MNEPLPVDSDPNDPKTPPGIHEMIDRAFGKYDHRMTHDDFNGFEESDFLSESPLEDVFWNYARKTDRDSWLDVKAQWQIGDYCSDSMFRTERGITLVELDGKAYHDRGRDLRRDWAILQMSKEVQQIIRIPYSAMMFYSRAAFSVLEHWEPSFRIARDLRLMEAKQFFETELPPPDQCGESGYRQWFKEASQSLDLILIDAQYERFAWVGNPIAFTDCHRMEPIRRITRQLDSLDPKAEAIAERAIRSDLTFPLQNHFKRWIQSWS